MTAISTPHFPHKELATPSMYQISRPRPMQAPSLSPISAGRYGFMAVGLHNLANIHLLLSARSAWLPCHISECDKRE